MALTFDEIMITENDILKQFANEIYQRIAAETIFYLDTKKGELISTSSDLEYFWEDIYTDHSVYDSYKDKDYSIWDINKGLNYDDTVSLDMRLCPCPLVQ